MTGVVLLHINKSAAHRIAHRIFQVWAGFALLDGDELHLHYQLELHGKNLLSGHSLHPVGLLYCTIA